jgi:hypothetical protein
MNAPVRTMLIIWHSRTGASRQLAVAAARGATESLRQDEPSGQPPEGGLAPARLEGVQRQGCTSEPHDSSVGIICVPAGTVDAQRMCDASAYIFVAPENLGSLSGEMKEFFDRTYYGVLDKVEGRPYATIIAAGSDGQGAARQVARIATGWRLKAVAEPMIVITRAQTPEEILASKRLPREVLARAAELGAALAQGLALGIY